MYVKCLIIAQSNTYNIKINTLYINSVMCNIFYSYLSLIVNIVKHNILYKKNYITYHVNQQVITS